MRTRFHKWLKKLGGVVFEGSKLRWRYGLIHLVYPLFTPTHTQLQPNVSGGVSGVNAALVRLVLLPVRRRPHVVAREDVLVDSPSTKPQKGFSTEPGFKVAYDATVVQINKLHGKKKRKKRKRMLLLSTFFFFPHLFCLHFCPVTQYNVKAYQHAHAPPIPPPLLAMAELQREVKGQAWVALCLPA